VPLYPTAQGPQNAAMQDDLGTMGAPPIEADDDERPVRRARGKPSPNDDPDRPAWDRRMRW
jgi:hypothetical protein